MKYKRILALVLVLLSVMGMLAGCSGKSFNPEESYKIAFMGPFTGLSTFNAISMRAAIQACLDDINAQGGINGKTLVCDFYDDKNRGREAIIVAQKIIQDPDVLACIGPYSASCALTVAPVFQKAGILLISPTVSHPEFTDAGDYIVRGAYLQEYLQEETARFLTQELGAKTVGLLAQNDDVGQAIQDLLPDALESYGGELVASEVYTPGMSIDFSAQITKIMTYDPDVLYFWGDYKNIAVMVQQANMLGFDGIYFSHSNVMKTEFFDLAAGHAEGMYMLSTIDPTSDNSVYQALAQRMEETTGEVLEENNAVAYDLVSLLAECIRQVGPDREKLKEAVRNYKGFEGLTADFDMIDGECHRKLYPLVIQDGQYVPYEVKNIEW